ncbi:hypothetical protein BT69DRAFT_748765 [Atractiella rhizophila]|nr:hypothetical protein BT69DRAFT_748765 [Atractiella rhizophila]
MQIYWVIQPAFLIQNLNFRFQPRAPRHLVLLSSRKDFYRRGYLRNFSSDGVHCTSAQLFWGAFIPTNMGDSHLNNSPCPSFDRALVDFEEPVPPHPFHTPNSTLSSAQFTLYNKPHPPLDLVNAKPVPVGESWNQDLQQPLAEYQCPSIPEIQRCDADRR